MEPDNLVESDKLPIIFETFFSVGNMQQPNLIRIE